MKALKTLFDQLINFKSFRNSVDLKGASIYIQNNDNVARMLKDQTREHSTKKYENIIHTILQVKLLSHLDHIYKH